MRQDVQRLPLQHLRQQRLPSRFVPDWRLRGHGLGADAERLPVRRVPERRVRREQVRTLSAWPVRLAPYSLNIGRMCKTEREKINALLFLLNVSSGLCGVVLALVARYQIGSCTGRSNGYQCIQCANTICPAGFTRTGTRILRDIPLWPAAP